MNGYYKETKRQEMLEYGIEFFHQKTDRGKIATNSHVHDAVEFLFITDGSFQILCDGVGAETYAGDLVLIRSGCIHTVKAGECENNGYYVFKIDPTVIFDLTPKATAGKYTLCLTIFEPSSKFVWRGAELQATAILSDLGRMINESASTAPAHDIVMRSTALSTVADVIRELEKAYKTEESLPSPVYTQIYKSMKYINEHYAEDIGALEMSRLTNMSYSYFSRSFIKVTGKSFRQYLNLVRIRRAERLLITSDKSVTEIAALTGYNNVSHFIATYKRVKGQTPHKYKNRI